MSRRNSIAIDMVRRRLRAIQVAPDGDGLYVERVLVAQAPESLDLDDPELIGRWIAERLDGAGIPRARATLAIPREEIVLKRITLPTTDVYELPGMVHLAVRRDLPFDPDEAVIDFITLAESDGESTVLAVAIPAPALEAVRATAKAAGLQPERISLRCMGTASLLLSLRNGSGAPGGWLGVDITSDGVELTVIEDGAIRFSRAAEVHHLDDIEQFAEAVVTETRRSWMSYRIVEDSEDISRAVITGARSVAETAATSIGDLLTVRTDVLAKHPLINDDGHDLSATWPLAGLLLEPALGAEMIDFNKPRKAPDRYARRRQVSLAAAGFLLVVSLAGLLFASKSIAGLEAEKTQLGDDVRNLIPVHHQYRFENFRLAHLEKWNEARVDWLDHLTFLQTRLPDPNDLVLRDWSGSMDFRGVQYDKNARNDEPAWTAPKRIIVSLAGEAATREMADVFRESLVKTKEYTTLTSGPDTTGGSRYPFKLTLRTTDSSPMVEEPDDVGGSGAGEPTAASGDDAETAGEGRS